MSLEAWLAFCATELVLCLSPGPAVLLVVSMSLGRGVRSGLGAALGVLSTNAAYFAISATGVAAALVASRELFVGLRWAGAAYLIAVGLRMLLAGRTGTTATASPQVGRSFARGVVVQGANPKALIFFVALLPQFIDPAGSVLQQTLVLGISSVVIELVVLAAYAAAASRARSFGGDRLARPLERLGGGLLIAVGARLALVGAD